MSYKEIIKIYNARKEKIQRLVEEDSHLLDENRLLQLRGAIDEIEMFVSVLEQYKQQSMVTQNQPSLSELHGKNKYGMWSKLIASIFG
ncbi:MAG: hypothetical protein ACOCZQ_02475 [Nanoarchaeota archaeon]